MTRFDKIRRRVRRILALIAILIAVPIGARALHHSRQDMPQAYWQADWSSAGILPAADAHKPAMVRVFAARTGRWKGIFAVHTWIVVKERDAGEYERYEKVGWGSPLRSNAYPPDARWYSNAPYIVYAANGADAEKLIPGIRKAVAAYPFRHHGDYTVWPGPNSNTFTACVIAAAPGLNAALPPTAIGKDYSCNGSWLARTPSGTGLRLSFGGLLGVTVAWVEGVELNVLGAVIGVDLRRPAVKLPAIGRIGV